MYIVLTTYIPLAEGENPEAMVRKATIALHPICMDRSAETGRDAFGGVQFLSNEDGDAIANEARSQMLAEGTKVRAVDATTGEDADEDAQAEALEGLRSSHQKKVN